MASVHETVVESVLDPSSGHEQIVAVFEKAWREGKRPSIDDYLAFAQADRLPLLIELAHAELECRLKAGEAARVEEYLKRYSELTQDSRIALDLIAAEYGLRLRNEPDLTLEEYGRRFPQFSPDLPAHLQTASVGKTSRSFVTQIRALQGLPEAPLPGVPGYEILGVLGRGGMGVVYRARQIQLKRLVALKMIRDGALAGPRELTRFRAEAVAVARLQHPNNVQIYEVGEAQGRPYFSLEYIAGGSLAQKLDGTPLAARAAAELVETLARAVHYAHQHGIVHRDLSPSNILLSAPHPPGPPLPPRGEGVQDTLSPLPPWWGRGRGWGLTPKITDFGLAKRLEESGQTQSDAILGTPSYMAPEQAAGRLREIVPATDVYALGAILYELLTGRRAFQGASVLDTLEQVRTAESVAPAASGPACRAIWIPSVSSVWKKTRAGAMSPRKPWLTTCDTSWTTSPSWPGRSDRGNGRVSGPAAVRRWPPLWPSASSPGSAWCLAPPAF